MGGEEKKLLLRMMLKDMMNIKIRIRILMSMKAKGQKTDEFGEDIDESIKELKEELQMIIMAYVELCETNENTGERTKDGNELMSRTMAYSNSNIDLEKLMQDSDFIDSAMNRKMSNYNEPLKDVAKRRLSIKTHSTSAKRERVPQNEKEEKKGKSQEAENNKKEENKEPEKKDQKGENKKPQEPKVKVMKKPQESKPQAQKNGHLIQVKSSEAKQIERTARQRGIQREMSKNQRAMTAPQMGRF